MAVVLDADFESDHWGFKVTLKKVTKILKDNGYGEPNIQFGGLSFPHSDGLNSIGLWIMPDNYSEGMLEDWIKKSVQDSELSLLDRAINTVKDLPNKKFKSIHNSKAEVATWLSWQRRPGCGFDGAIDENLFNFQCESMTQLINWLNRIYITEKLEEKNPADQVCKVLI